MTFVSRFGLLHVLIVWPIIIQHSFYWDRKKLFRGIKVQLRNVASPGARLERILEKLSGAVVSMMDHCAGDPGPILTGAEFPTGI